MTHPKRIHPLNNAPPTKGPVIYWMSRDQRVEDNWALIHSIETAKTNHADLAVVFCLTAEYPGANLRHFDFLLKGLSSVEQKLSNTNIPFFLLKGDPLQSLPVFIKEYKPGMIITDFDPLRVKMHWRTSLAAISDIPILEVDTHNIVPCRFASNKADFGAYILRPKIKKWLPEFMDIFPELSPVKKQTTFSPPLINWADELSAIRTDRSVLAVNWLKPGEDEAMKVLMDFMDKKIHNYDEKRNDPNEDVTSNLSPYFHFGHISPQRVAMEVSKLPPTPNKEGFLEEMIVRRELSDNFCFYNPEYDQFSGFPDWAKKTLNEHRRDEREYIYTEQQLERAETHDNLWNAAQKEMTVKGKMHGYMRMYWAKKILEWTPSPEEALRVSIYLNDKYQLDGRDPNGYTGCAWSIGGVHDRAWSERPVFGKIRFMNYKGCKRKFDVDRYVVKNSSGVRL